MHEATASGKLMQFASHLAPIGQAHEGEDRSAQLDSKRAAWLLMGCSS